ncbi:hypothetical protein [Candidatus Poriferisocius sp.]|uniref:hypothetical protein n=1 Tax=Candidatus Poriferisocius sp. TaxID=3101276 RepID=UPI003B5C658D
MAGMLNRGRGLFRKSDLLGLDTSYKQLTKLKAGQLVYSRLFAWEGAISIVPDEFDGVHVSPEFPAFDLDNTEVLSDYLAHIARWSDFHEKVADSRKGLGLRRQRVAPEALLKVEIPLPDITEQRRIATHLDKMNELVEGLPRKQDYRNETLLSLEQSAFHEEFNEYRTYEYISSIATVHRGIGPQYDPDSNSLCVNQGCVQRDGMTLSRARTVDSLWAELVKTEKRVGEFDVLVNSTGEGTIGRSCLPGNAVGLPFDSHVLSVRPNLDRLQPAFLNFFLRSPQGQLAIEEVKSAKTTKQTELGKRKLESIAVPVPTMRRQDETVLRLSSILNHVGRTRFLCQQSGKLQRGILGSALNQAFAGLA